MSRKFDKPTPIFLVENKNNDKIISEAVLRQARKSGRLNLNDKHLVLWPEEILKLGVVHSENDDIDFEGKAGDDYKWWELEPLKYLDLSCNSIKTIPKEVNQLDSLMTLLLHQNILETLPKELGQLRQLVKLDLGHNKIQDFPRELSELKELRNLNLSNNAFNKFPEPVYDLIMLNNLDISSNAIEDMVPGIGFLTRLVSLNLSNNKLSNIPNDITNCLALKDLNLSNNKITSSGLPELVDMHKLEVIQLQYNHLSSLPNVKGCSELKEIHLGFNKIEMLIPDDKDQEVTVEELSTLSHLQVINLRNNLLKVLPKELCCLQNLVRLDLSNNDLKELPATLSLLPHLENLLVEGNSLRTIRRDIILGGTHKLVSYLKKLLPEEETEVNLNLQNLCIAAKEFPDRYSMRCSRTVNLSCRELCNVPNSVFEEALTVPCTIVDLSKNKLREIPSGVWLLCKTLNDLNLSHNQLKEIPAEIKTCLNLRYLNVANNHLESLPEEFACCARMRELNISVNRLEQIPSCVYSLSALEILSLCDNKIESLDAENLLGLKALTHLDLTNNDLTNVPPLIGKMTQLRTLGLDGNRLRTLRQATIAMGTEAVLAWLRNKIA